MEKKVRVGKIKKKWLFLAIVLFAWFNLSRAQNSGLNIFQDKDQDGLTDQEEAAYGTNPDEADTDHDGYSDGAEIKSGYDPKKPAPGDKLVQQTTAEETKVAGEKTETSNQKQTAANGGENLTNKFIEKLEQEKGSEFDALQELSQNPASFQDQGKLESLENVSLTQEELETMLKDTLANTQMEDELELIAESEMKILPKPEGKDEKEIKATEKKQIEAYIVAAGYVLMKNAPFEVKDQTDAQTKIMSLVTEVGLSLQNNELSQLETLKEKANKTFEELKAVEVPYEMKSIHQTALSLFRYLLEQETTKLTNQEDPLQMVVMIGKVQAVAGEMESLQLKMEEVLKAHDIVIEDILGTKTKSEEAATEEDSSKKLESPVAGEEE